MPNKQDDNKKVALLFQHVKISAKKQVWIQQQAAVTGHKVLFGEWT